MAKSKDKNFNVSVMPENVMYTSINTSKDGYNSARMVVKMNDSEYMSISYEWEGSGIPGFAMDLMGFMKQNNMEASGAWEGQGEAPRQRSAGSPSRPSKGRGLEGESESVPRGLPGEGAVRGAL